VEIKKDAALLRVIIGETDKAGKVPAFEKIVIEARNRGLAGATVFKGIMGYGRSSRIHSSKILRLSEDLPVIIEIVDEINKLMEFLPFVTELFENNNLGGIATLEKAEVIFYRTAEK